MWRELRLFLSFLICGAIGGFLGSVLGGAFGKRDLFAGGYIGGVLAVIGAAWLAAHLAWLPRRERTGAMVGGAAGFLAAATVAVNTLSSPVGPLLSTLLIGVGAFCGRALQRRWSRTSRA